MHITSTLDLRHPRSHRRGRAAAIGAAGGSGGHSMLVGGSLPTPANRAATTAAAVDAASAAAEVSSEPVAILVWLRTLGWVGGGVRVVAVTDRGRRLPRGASSWCGHPGWVCPEVVGR